MAIKMTSVCSAVSQPPNSEAMTPPMMPIAVHMGFREQALVAIVILCGAPSTVSGYVMAKNMGADHVLSSSIIVLTTVLSAITLTLTLFILKSLALI